MPIVYNTDEEYHASDGVSKSGLWELITKTPAHYKFVKQEEKPHFSIGKAAHIAILEPETLEARVTRGPADRRGNKWKEAQDFAAFSQTILLTEGDYDQAMLIRDLASTVPQLDILRSGDPIVEASAYHVDEETGVQVRCRPDIYSKTHKLIGDIKNVADASLDGFQRSIGKFGYHMQDAIYTDAWSKGAGLEVDGFFFIVFEKSDPPFVAVYELDAPSAEEGYALYRQALQKYAECEREDRWPAYSDGVQRIGLRKYDYRILPPPDRPEAEEEEQEIEGYDEQ